MKLSVFHTPELVPTQDLADCAIAIDILRATTTIVTALANGAEAIQVFADLENLSQASALHPQHLRLRAAERGGAKVEGYDLGNSPFDYAPEVVRGKRIFMSTTNGTRALTQVQACSVVLAAAMVNLGAIVNYLKQTQPARVWLVGSGWQGNYALEDTACAGAIVAALEGEPGAELANDEAYGAVALYQTWRDRLEQLFHHASHGQRLLKLNCAADLTYAATLDQFNVVPRQVAPGILQILE